MSHLLEEAEHLERQAADGRVRYFWPLVGERSQADGFLLDIGCGNGYSVASWIASGVPAFGLDHSLYRMGRWAAEHGSSPRMVVGDAAHLPFRTGTVSVVVSSGMIEHIGVAETVNPYSVTAHADQDEKRAAVVAELARVTAPGGTLIVDCPNGSFPIDFWHGDRLGAVRFHPIPDSLLPGHNQLLRWGEAAGLRSKLLPLGARLQFRQIRSRWWGRLLSPIVAGVLYCFDRFIRTPVGTLLAWFYPYVVVGYEKPRASN